MDLKKAKRILLNRAYVCRIEKIPHRPKSGARWLVVWEWGRREMTDREIIRYARGETSESSQKTSIKKNVKKFSHDKNRTATRDAIKKESWDSIPQEGPVKEEDIWSWD
jgi:hypothetical protein